jgi:hypothetical protein
MHPRVERDDLERPCPSRSPLCSWLTRPTSSIASPLSADAPTSLLASISSGDSPTGPAVSPTSRSATFDPAVQRPALANIHVATMLEAPLAPFSAPTNCPGAPTTLSESPAAALCAIGARFLERYKGLDFCDCRS